MNHLRTAFLFSVFFLLFSHCTKDEIVPVPTVEEDLPSFTYGQTPLNRNSDNVKKDIAFIKEEILRKNRKKKFLIRLVNMVGSPDWRNVQSVHEKGKGFPYYIPLYKENSKKTRAILRVKQKKSNPDRLKFKLIERRPFFDYLFSSELSSLKKRDIIHAHLFNLFDQEIFGFSSKRLNRFLVKAENSSEAQSQASLNRNSCEYTQICVTVCSPQPYVGNCSTKCRGFYDCDDGAGGDISGGGGYPGGTGGGGGSGGSSGGGSCYSCGDDFPEDEDPSAAFENLNESQYYSLLIEGKSKEWITDFNILLGRVSSSLGSFSWPSNSFEWNDFSEILQAQLSQLLDPETLAQLVIPGYAQVKSAIKQYENKKYLGTAFALCLGITEIIPVKKAAKIGWKIGTKLSRSSSLLTLYNRVKKLGNHRVYNGFKKTSLREMKNPHIFIRNAGHIGTPDFDFILSKSGSKHEMIAKVYEEAFRSGKLANLTSTFTKRSITLYGKKLDFTAAHLNGRIFISNFFTP